MQSWRTPSWERCRRAVRSELRLDADVPIVLSVDRFEHMQGIEERILIAERVFERGMPVAFVQLLSPWIGIHRDPEFERIRAQVERINVRFGDGRAARLFLLNRHFEPHEVYRYYRAADIFYVSSLHDCTTVVGKDLEGDRDDDHGVILFSRFAGTARELQQSLLVNAHDPDGAADMILTTLTLSVHEQRSHMRSLHSVAAYRNVYH